MFTGLFGVFLGVFDSSIGCFKGFGYVFAEYGYFLLEDFVGHGVLRVYGVGKVCDAVVQSVVGVQQRVVGQSSFKRLLIFL